MNLPDLLAAALPPLGLLALVAFIARAVRLVVDGADVGRRWGDSEWEDFR